MSNMLFADSAVDPTSWAHTGLGSYLERWGTRPEAFRYFAGKFQQSGGVRDMAKFFKRFAISGDMEISSRELNIYQAGIVFSYLAKGSDKKLVAAWEKVRVAIRHNKKKLSKALSGFEKAAAKLRTQPMPVIRGQPCWFIFAAA